RMRANFVRAKEQQDAKARQSAIAEIKVQQQRDEEEKKKADDEARRRAAEEQKEKDRQELTSTRPDTPDEAEFRALARVKLRSQTGKPAATYVAQLEENGRKNYKLGEVQSKRIVSQELERLDHVQEYRDTFKELIAADKTIDAGERDTLNKLAARF